MIHCVDPVVECNLPLPNPKICCHQTIYIAQSSVPGNENQCMTARHRRYWKHQFQRENRSKIWKHICRMIFEILMETSLVREKNFMSSYSSSGMFVYLRDVTFPIVAFFIRKDWRIPLSRNPGKPWLKALPTITTPSWKCIQGAIIKWK